jgi:protein SCO1/2
VLLRIRLALLALMFCLAAALTGVLIAEATRDRADGGGLELTDGWAGALRPPGAHVPEFVLLNQDGDYVKSDSLLGQPVVYTFIYSTCRDTCPAQVQTIRGALDDLGRDVRVVGISVDPANDTPERAEAFLLKQRMTGRMDFLLGSRYELAKLWRAFGVQPQQGDLDHSATTVLVDARGRQRIGFPFDWITPERLAHDLNRL